MNERPRPGPPPLFLPTSCPECDRIIAPAERPKPGDRARCPYCETLIVFADSGVFVREGSSTAPS